MKVIFSSSPKVGSFILRTLLFSEWSHCGVVVDNFVIEATLEKGVVKTPLSEFKHDRKWAIVEFPVPNEQVAIEELYKQIGSKYDWLGLFGIPFIRNWQKENRWFCSELVEHVLRVGGLAGFRYLPYRITPRDLWNLPHPIIDKFE